MYGYEDFKMKKHLVDPSKEKAETFFESNPVFRKSWCGKWVKGEYIVPKNSESDCATCLRAYKSIQTRFLKLKRFL